MVDFSRCYSHVPHIKAKLDIYAACYEFSQKSGFARISGLPIGVATSAIYLSRKVSLIGECTFKGAVNVVASPFSSKFSATNGFFMLGAAAFKTVKLPYSLVVATFSVVDKTVQAAVRPESYYEKKWQRQAEKFVQ